MTHFEQLVDEVRNLTMAELEAGVDFIRQSPKTNGVVELIVRRPSVATREILSEGHLDLRDGLIGDTWKIRSSVKTADGSPHPEMQVTIMNSRAINLIAQHRDRWQLAGDQFYVDMDLSSDNVPAGSQLAIGSAVIEITAPPHTGCKKFVARFGLDAMKFVNSPIGRELQLRGLHAKVITSGTVRVGDLARKL